MKRFTSLRMVILLTVSIITFGYFTVTVEAFPITYEFSGTGVFGSFNGTDFNDGTFSVAIAGDTANVDTTDPSNPFIENLLGIITFWASEIGTYTGNFSNPLYVFVYNDFVENVFEVVGFGDGLFQLQNDLLDIWAPGQGLLTYDLKSNFGPVTGSLYFASEMGLDIGTFSIEDAGSLAFTAVPEPGTIMLLGSGLLGLIGFARKKFMK